MNGSFLLDTNIIIALLNGEETLTRHLRSDPEVYLPVIAIGELYYGAYRSVNAGTNLKRVSELTETATVLPCDPETAQHYGKIKDYLRSKGRPLPENDLWIAAISQQHNLTILTRDQHFREIHGLAVESW